MADWQDHIGADPAVLLGKPVIKGTRIAVEFVTEKLSLGWSVEDFIEQYPHVRREDVMACLSYATALLQKERVYAAAP